MHLYLDDNQTNFNKYTTNTALLFRLLPLESIPAAPYVGTLDEKYLSVGFFGLSGVTIIRARV